MLKAMLKNDVRILTAWDAHVPKNVGRLIREMEELIADSQREVCFIDSLGMLQAELLHNAVETPENLLT